MSVYEERLDQIRNRRLFPPNNVTELTRNISFYICYVETTFMISLIERLLEDVRELEEKLEGLKEY